MREFEVEERDIVFVLFCCCVCVCFVFLRSRYEGEGGRELKKVEEFGEGFIRRERKG
jgi:hypothetical protein